MAGSGGVPANPLLLEPPGGGFYISGRAFDMARIDAVVVALTTEEWRIVNANDVSHAFHIHINSFRVVSLVSLRHNEELLARDIVLGGGYLA
jgi:FtsP/CotA-like multicopper oxidase with cupredoxin domain